ncbi:MAG: MFS transporter [Azospirillaceae bacterium]|nr:MFS transporter [Azospirillaceae bacterium]
MTPNLTSSDIRSGRLPLAGLLALATAGFITILTEALPAGLLPQMSRDFGVSTARTGQLVTLYAMGSLIAAIPLTVATRRWRRRPLLLAAIGDFAVVNSITAISTSYALTLVARFAAGVFAGLLWALLAGYASRMAPAPLRGRAIAVAMVGTPLALSLGIPAGTFLGAVVGWRYSFGVMSFLSLILIGWVLGRVPDFPGQRLARPFSLVQVLALPGIREILFVTLAFVLAHNVLYTYIAPFLVPAGIAGRIDVVLLVFGIAALVSIWIVGVLIDQWLRELVLLSTLLFLLVAVILGLWGSAPLVIYAGVVLWGLAFGGAATLFQTASSHAAGEAADVAQSMIVTVWNAAIAGGGSLGGLLLDGFGTAAFPWAVTGLLIPALLVAWQAKRHGFSPSPCR